MTAKFTRRDYVPNKRLHLHSSMGVDFRIDVEPEAGVAPEPEGTKLTFSWDGTGMMKVIDKAFFHDEAYVEETLSTWKKEIEAQS